MHSHYNTSEYGHSILGCDCPNPDFPKPSWVETVKPHTHVTPDGLVVQCYHQCKSMLLSAPFWLGLTLGFPFEHFLYEKVWPFTLLTKLLGL
jgi:hypothetical protein